MKNVSLEINSDFIFIVVFRMVRCFDAEFATFWKKKSSLRWESEAPKEVEAVFEVEAIPAILISEMAAAEVLDVPPEVLEGAKIEESIKVPRMAEAPTEEGSPSWAAGIS